MHRHFPCQTDKKNKKTIKSQNNCVEPSNYIKITIIIITLAVSISIRRIGIISMNILLHYVIYIHKYPLYSCCFPPRMCLSTLENKKVSFLFHWIIQQTPNTLLMITHTHTYTVVWEFSLDLTCPFENTHTFTRLSLWTPLFLQHGPIMHLWAGWKGTSTSTFLLWSRAHDITATGRLQQRNAFSVYTDAFLLHDSLVRSLVRINRCAVLEVINTLWTIHLSV